MKEYHVKLIDTLAVDNTLGEGIIWNSKDGAAWWTDIHESTLYRYHLASKEIQHWPMPERLAAFGFIKNDKRMIVAFASGFAYFDLQSGSIEWLAKPEETIEGNRLNDGRVDRQGRFWAGTMIEDAEKSTQAGALYCIDSNGHCTQHEQNISISNGLCWSPDSRLMYHADSPQQTIYVYDFDPETGTASNRRQFAKTQTTCYPDGSTVDSEGYLFNAQWQGSSILRYTPEGKVDGIIKLPVSQPTCMTFGGDNKDILFVTTAKENLSDSELAKQPQAGNVFIYQTEFTGLEDPTFIYKN